MKAKELRPNKIDRGHEISDDDNQCNRTDADEDNEDQRNRTTKDEQKLFEYKFGDFYPKDQRPPEGCKFCTFHMNYELKHDLRKKFILVMGGNRLDASTCNISSSMV